MNSHILITKKGYIPFLSSRKASRESFKLWYKKTSVICIALIWILWVYNVYSYNISSTTSYKTGEILKVNKDIRSKTERLSVIIADYESSSHVEDLWKSFGMIKAWEPNYIEFDTNKL